VGEVITGCRGWCRTSSAIRLHWTQKCVEIILKTASCAVLVDPPPNWVLCGDAGLAGRCYATCSIASPSLGQCTGIQDRLGTAPGAGHLATPQRTAFERCICFQKRCIKQKRATLFTATSWLSVSSHRSRIQLIHLNNYTTNISQLHVVPRKRAPSLSLLCQSSWRDGAQRQLQL
jgi:hypothetical protein